MQPQVCILSLYLKIILSFFKYSMWQFLLFRIIIHWWYKQKIAQKVQNGEMITMICYLYVNWTTGGRPGVPIVGGTGKVGDKVEVFNPFANKSCALPNLYKGENRSQSTLCSGLLCGGLEPYALTSCLIFEGDEFYPTKVTLLQKRRYDVCWTRDDGVQLLGGPGNGLASLLSSEIVKFDGSSSSSSFPLEYKLE